jgi:hypothetical protein
MKLFFIVFYILIFTSYNTQQIQVERNPEHSTSTEFIIYKIKTNEITHSLIIPVAFQFLVEKKVWFVEKN